LSIVNIVVIIVVLYWFNNILTRTSCYRWRWLLIIQWWRFLLRYYLLSCIL